MNVGQRPTSLAVSEDHRSTAVRIADPGAKFSSVCLIAKVAEFSSGKAVVPAQGRTTLPSFDQRLTIDKSTALFKLPPNGSDDRTRVYLNVVNPAGANVDITETVVNQTGAMALRPTPISMTDAKNFNAQTRNGSESLFPSDTFNSTGYGVDILSNPQLVS
jgi:hypothetical protein